MAPDRPGADRDDPPRSFFSSLPSKLHLRRGKPPSAGVRVRDPPRILASRRPHVNIPYELPTAGDFRVAIAARARRIEERNRDPAARAALAAARAEAAAAA